MVDTCETILENVWCAHVACDYVNLQTGPDNETLDTLSGDHVISYPVPSEEERHIKAVQNAMESKGILDHTIIHGVFVGLARSGKDSLMKRLLRKELSSVSPSTAWCSRKYCTG